MQKNKKYVEKNQTSLSVPKKSPCGVLPCRLMKTVVRDVAAIAGYGRVRARASNRLGTAQRQQTV